MLAIPAIDLIGNKVVRLNKGDYNQVTYYDYSVTDLAKKYADNGFKTLHLVDLMGSKTGEISAIPVIEQISKETGLKINFGGGIRCLEDAKKLYSSGVNRLVIGSMAVKDKKTFEEIASVAGSDKIIIAADVLNDKIAVKGWTEVTEITVADLINYGKSLGIAKYLCTDINRDGMMTGANNDLYKKLMNEFPDVQFIASGGINSIENVKELDATGIYGAVLGKSLLENKITIEELKEFA